MLRLSHIQPSIFTKNFTIDEILQIIHFKFIHQFTEVREFPLMLSLGITFIPFQA